MIRLRPAHPEEAPELTRLCLRSKAVWGYDQAFMEACRDELTISARDFGQSAICVAVNEQKIIGMAQVCAQGDDAQLQKLFIDPAAMRTGAGRNLFAWCVSETRNLQALRLWIEADPDAAAFYRKMGAVNDGTVPSESIPGRVLPRLRFDLKTTGD